MKNNNLTFYKVLCFDFGLRYIGVSVGQSITETASPLPYLFAKKGVPQWDEVTKLIKEWSPNMLLLGNPLHLDGSPSNLEPHINKFKTNLETKYNLPVLLQDERLSTKEALTFTDDPLKTHSISAVLIAESWFYDLKNKDH